MLIAVRKPYLALLSTFINAKNVAGTRVAGSTQSIGKTWESPSRANRAFQQHVRFVRTACKMSVPGTSLNNKEKVSSRYLRDKMLVPDSDPPNIEDINLLYQFFDQSKKLVILTGAGISTECGIPDYRSPNGAYSTGFKPITHQEFVRSSRAQRRYWTRSYAGWRRFTAAQPGAAHIALASLEKASRIKYMITQNVDRLHHHAGSSPLELHGTVYVVVCIECGFSFSRNVFQDELKALNPKWAEAIESLEYDSRSDKSFGMKQRPDGDIEIDEKFWEEDFHIPTCLECNGVLKPDVVFFGDNVPKDKAETAMEAAKQCDAFLVLGSSLMTMSAFRLVRLMLILHVLGCMVHWRIIVVWPSEIIFLIFLHCDQPWCHGGDVNPIRAAHEEGAATAIVNVGTTRADDFVPLKINARVGEILPRLLNVGSLHLPALQ